MYARYNPNITNITANLAKRGIDLTKVVDADEASPKMPPDVLHNNGDAQTQFWVRTHPGNGPGNLQIAIDCKEGGESPLTDPLDEECSGLNDWIAKHTPPPPPVPA